MPVSSMLVSSMMSSGGGQGGGQGIANLGGGLVSGLVGLFQKRKANKLLKNLQRPTYSVPNEVLQNQKMAQLGANEGMPSQQYSNTMKNLKESQANAIAAASDRRAGLMALPKIIQQSNAAYGNLDAQSAGMRLQNQRTLYGINSEVGKYRDKEFDINKMQPYQRDYGYAMSLLGTGNQNLTSGLDKLIAGGGQIATSMNYGNSSSGSNRRRYSAGSTNSPSYYGGYDADSNYSGFETGH